jgi:hypothetical protein
MHVFQVCAYEANDESFYSPASNCNQNCLSSSYGANCTFNQVRPAVTVEHNNCGPFKEFDEPVKAWNSFTPNSFASPGISHHDASPRPVPHGQQTMFQQQPIARIPPQENMNVPNLLPLASWGDSNSSQMDSVNHFRDSARLNVPKIGMNFLSQNQKNISFNGATFPPPSTCRGWGKFRTSQPRPLFY